MEETETPMQPESQHAVVSERQVRRLKDPKKQEAGRKGAAVRKQKQEAIMTELSALKEKAYSEQPPSERQPSELLKEKEKTLAKRKTTQYGWLLRPIGVVVVLGVGGILLWKNGFTLWFGGGATESPRVGLTETTQLQSERQPAHVDPTHHIFCMK